MKSRLYLLTIAGFISTGICCNQTKSTYTTKVIDDIKHIYNEKQVWNDKSKIEAIILSKLKIETQGPIWVNFIPN